jgi:hypothetical protein
MAKLSDLGKNTLQYIFLEVTVVFFLEWVKYCYIVFKPIWKTWQKWDEKVKLTCYYFKPKKNYQKDKCSIQGGLYKGWHIQCHNPNYPKKFIIMDFFLLVELETKPITFYHYTLKYHNT